MMHATAAARLRCRGAFTLVEVIVAVAVVTILAAAILPGLVRSLEVARVDRAQELFETFADGIDDFRADVPRYPSRLSQLVTEISSADDNSCGANFSNGHANQWDGPYVRRVITTTGVAIGIGTAEDLLVRVPPTASSALLMISVENVKLEDALELNERYDVDGGSGTAGTIRWTTPDAQGLTNLFFAMPVNGC